VIRLEFSCRLYVM